MFRRDIDNWLRSQISEGLPPFSNFFIMKNLKSWAKLICFLIASPLAHAQIENLQVSGTTYQDTVQFVVHNTGSQTVIFSYIIIQDQILFTARKEATVLGEKTIVIKLYAPNATSHSYTMDVSDVERSSNSEEVKNQVSVYPNPAKDHVLVDLPQVTGKTFDIVLFNQDGESVVEYLHVTDSVFLISQGGLPDGVYFLRVSNSTFLNCQIIIFN